MQPNHSIQTICETLDGVNPKASWGETSLFYNPGLQLPNGVYFCTIKEKDGDNDKHSNLDRSGVFRVAIGLHPKTYQRLFGPKPSRPAKSGVVDTGHDFTACNVLMPHPVYAWMSWAQLLSPSQAMFDTALPYIVEAHGLAVTKFNKKVASRVV